MRNDAIGIIVLLLILTLIVWLTSVRTTVRVIDGCEYIASDGAYHHTLTHKGNCTNIIHLR